MPPAPNATDELSVPVNVRVLLVVNVLPLVIDTEPAPMHECRNLRRRDLDVAAGLHGANKFGRLSRAEAAASAEVLVSAMCLLFPQLDRAVLAQFE